MMSYNVYFASLILLFDSISHTRPQGTPKPFSADCGSSSFFPYKDSRKSHDKIIKIQERQKPSVRQSCYTTIRQTYCCNKPVGI